MDAEMLRNVLTMLGTVLGAILVLMLVAKITSMVHVEADDARAPSTASIPWAATRAGSVNPAAACWRTSRWT